LKQMKQTIARTVDERRVTRLVFRAVLVTAFALVAGMLPARSQSSNNGGISGSGSQSGMSGVRPGFGRQGAGPLSNDDDDVDPVISERRMKALNVERQKQMVADANKLLKLAKELNEEVASTNTGAFTPDQLRKIGEIEKLARNVKERMTAASGSGPGLLAPPTLVYPVH
jgi:hypothetical protein